jgi:hypothetical protein
MERKLATLYMPLLQLLQSLLLWWPQHSRHVWLSLQAEGKQIQHLLQPNFFLTLY